MHEIARRTMLEEMTIDYDIRQRIDTEACKGDNFQQSSLVTTVDITRRQGALHVIIIFCGDLTMPTLPRWIL